jgi:hypothetical protein
MTGSTVALFHHDCSTALSPAKIWLFIHNLNMSQYEMEASKEDTKRAPQPFSLFIQLALASPGLK